MSFKVLLAPLPIPQLRHRNPPLRAGLRSPPIRDPMPSGSLIRLLLQLARGWAPGAGALLSAVLLEGVYKSVWFIWNSQGGPAWFQQWMLEFEPFGKSCAM